MQNKFAELSARNFNPMSVTGLSDEARKAVNAAFDAMSTWRIETAKNSEKNSEQVIERWLRLPARWDGRSKSSMPPARKCRASPECRSKRWIK